MKSAPMAVCGLVWALLLPGVCWPQTVSLPIRIDTPLLGALVVASSFPGPGRSARVLDEAGGCRRVTLSDPAFSEENGRIRLEVRVAVHAGVSVGSGCALEVDWEGYLVLFQDPRIDPQGWRLHFQTRDSALQTLDRKPARLAGLIWDLIKTQAYDYLDRISIDLSLPVGELAAFIQPLIAPDEKKRLRRVVDDLRLGAVTVERRSIVVPILLDLAGGGDGAGYPGAGEPLPGMAAERLLEIWEPWDEFLVSMIATLASRPLTEADRQVLFEVLLDTRHGLVAALEAPQTRKDFVRAQFVDAWHRLSPVFRTHLVDGSARSLLGYLAFFSASDALAALDGVGPTLGIEISREGLLRLVRLLDEGRTTALDYRPEVNPSLRQALGVGPPPEVAGEGGAARAPSGYGLLLGRISGAVLPSAWAAEAKLPRTREQLEPWLPLPDRRDSYLARVRELVDGSMRRAFAASPLNAHFEPLCLRVAPAVAWQESCLRQFEVKGERVDFLRSYNGTSVGVMQINERVWRGVYDRDALRWNIAYNARAGCEILALYLHRFLLPRAARESRDLPLDEELTARTLHAMYNGGPGEFGRFLGRHRQQSYYLSDRLFHEKYQWVAAGRWDYLSRCWGE